MSITISQKREYPITPEGTVSAVLGAITSWDNFPQDGKNSKTGKMETRFKTRLIFSYVTDTTQENGEPFSVDQFLWDSDITNKNSKLGPVLKKLTAGTSVTPEPGMDIESLIGTQVQVMVEHYKSPTTGRVSAQIGSFQRKSDQGKNSVDIPDGFAATTEERLEKMRVAILAKRGTSTAAAGAGANAGTVADEDIPF